MKNLIYLLGFLIFLSCETQEGIDTDFGVFSTEDGLEVDMNGEITSTILDDWEDLIDAYPDVEKIVMLDCPGSSDDEANLNFARAVRDQEVEIELTQSSEIASGAVDLFLAGVTRVAHPNGKIGVHSWADEENNEATDFERDHEVHQSYIRYFVEMGFSQQEAEDFYFFTIDASPASDIHWMTEQEIEEYGLLTE